MGLASYGPDAGYIGPIVTARNGNLTVGLFGGTGLFGGGGTVTFGYNCQ
jgi:hypothetical protein